ncbi:ChbG/HpnK family deacetylase [Cellulomonas cellasea]|uniref:Hopanoid biosynthesis associated protein HpnK n=1 Tax=Cellulomonas cellasea TaxID=43670 RepID=A0A7W4UEX7_9CELL|nr:ChbG/HpnK family deacetylase [Cellulomonas cellasea]MBB2922906.1 hopanoid biosynthesis associated protein HpnK [Cellulomonas cellasea]
MTRLLVVTADDLGLTAGVNRAVRRAHLDGIVTATSLLAVGRAFDDAVTMLRSTPTLELGAHLALVGEDPPLLTAREVPTLVDRRGAFPLSYRTLVARAAAGRVDVDDVRRELGAQLERVRDTGLPLTHVDTHQHTHLWPAVGRVVVELATAHGVPAVRTPRSRSRGPVGAGVSLLARAAARRADRAGLRTTADYAGLDEAGALDRERVARALRTAAAHGGKTLEINTHPGVEPDPELARFTWGYRWSDELAMLLDAETRRLVTDAGYHLGGFADLPDPTRGGTDDEPA